jgi:hypothetical protein
VAAVAACPVKTTKMLAEREASEVLEHDRLQPGESIHVRGFELDAKAMRELSQSARGMIILDEKASFYDAIDAITHYRRYEVPKARRLKWLVKFSYPVDSVRHPMIQVSDLVIFLTRKFLEMDNGYKRDWSSEAESFYASCYEKIPRTRGSGDSTILFWGRSRHSPPGAEVKRPLKLLLSLPIRSAVTGHTHNSRKRQRSGGRYRHCVEEMWAPQRPPDRRWPSVRPRRNSSAPRKSCNKSHGTRRSRTIAQFLGHVGDDRYDRQSSGRRAFAGTRSPSH